MKTKMPMTVETLEKIVELKEQGKSREEIAEVVGFDPATVGRYCVALQKVQDSGDIRSAERVSRQVVKDYLDQKGMELKMSEVNDKGESKVNYQNQLSSIKASNILDALERRTSTDTIAMLMGMEHGTVVKLQAYVELIKAKENEKALAYRRSGVFRDDVFDLIETRYKFKPKADDPAEREQIRKNEMLKNLLNTKETVASMDRKLIAMQCKLDSMEINQRNLIETNKLIMKKLADHDKDMERMENMTKRLLDGMSTIVKNIMSVDQSIRFVGSTFMNSQSQNGKR